MVPTHTTLPRLGQLQGSLRGRLILPGEREYDAARRVWNGMVDKRPAVIVRCAAVEDVVHAVHYARQQGLPIAIRGGGHNVAGSATVQRGLLIDLSHMRQVHVDPDRCTAAAQGGARLGDLDEATQRYGLATPLGVVSATGIAGLTLGGGYGWLRNKYGLTCDNLIGAQVVTWEGEILRASAQENADLLWALRGGGGNFGVVTEFVYQLHPVGPEVYLHATTYDGRGERMAEATAHFLELSRRLPDEFSPLIVLGRYGPGERSCPVDMRGEPFVHFAAVYCGDPEEGKRTLAPLLDYGPPVADQSRVLPFVLLQRLDADACPDGDRYYWKSLNVTRTDDDAIEITAAHAKRMPSPRSTVDIWPVGGAVTRFGTEHAAFHGRHAAFLVNPEANWSDPAEDEANVAWARDLCDALEASSDGSRYMNFGGFQGEGGDAMMARAFGPQYGRLQEIKAKYDPHNFFRINHNIVPDDEP